VTVTGAHMLVSVDGQSYYPVDLSEPGTDLILRVWDAQLYIKNVEISKLRP
jgi:hypothetical protein